MQTPHTHTHSARAHIGEGEGNLHGAVRVVALADVEEAGDSGAGHTAQLVEHLVETVLGAAEGEDDRLLRRLHHEVAVVAALALGAVAAAHEKELLDATLVDRLHHLRTRNTVP